MKELTATTKAGKEFDIEITTNINGLRAELVNGNNKYYVELDHANQGGNFVPTVFVSADTIFKILGVKVKGSVHIKLNEDWKSIENDFENEQNKIAMNAKIIGFTYKCGCDASDVYRFHYDFPENLSSKAISHRTASNRKLEKILNWEEIEEIAKTNGAEKLEADGMSYYGYKFNSQNVNFLIEATTKKLDKIQETAAIEDKKIKAIFAKAKETGEQQLLESYSDTCNNPDLECDIDTIQVWAMPDGSKKSIRHHCY